MNPKQTPCGAMQDPEDFPRLIRILSACRPYGSEAEQRLVTDILAPYAPALLGPMENACIQVGEGSRTLFSCHTDTVHRSPGAQRVAFDRVAGLLFTPKGDCLGADDGAGMWLMLSMIDAGIPGTYLFHRGEERGCIGAQWMAAHKAELLSRFDRAVAFDRHGTTSVITHQLGSRCCSDYFAQALADALRMGHTGDSTGIYTDTAQYMNLIPEVTNVSCGYEGEHTGTETLDVRYLVQLREALKKVDWEALPVVRQPGASAEVLDDLAGMDWDTLYGLVEGEPETITDLIFDHLERQKLALAGFDAEDFQNAQIYS